MLTPAKERAAVGKGELHSQADLEDKEGRAHDKVICEAGTKF